MNIDISSLKMQLWLLIKAPYFNYKYWRIKVQRHKYKILSSEDTVRYIIKSHCSVSRYGDGEFAMIYHLMDGGDDESFYIHAFQNYNPSLAGRLYEILQNTDTSFNHKVGIPHGIVSVHDYTGHTKVFWQRFTLLDIRRFSKILNKDIPYLDSCFTRFYLNRTIPTNQYVQNLKRIWKEKDICIVEGEKSRLGVNNDLFSGTKSIKRIICPSENAYSKYDEILSVCKKYPKEWLYILALGHTATVLAYDLSKEGYWALDLGHIDIEYEWYLMGAIKKEPVHNKYVNEICDGRIVEDCKDTDYLTQIVEQVL